METTEPSAAFGSMLNTATAVRSVVRSVTSTWSPPCPPSCGQTPSSMIRELSETSHFNTADSLEQANQI